MTDASWVRIGSSSSWGRDAAPSGPPRHNLRRQVAVAAASEALSESLRWREECFPDDAPPAGSSVIARRGNERVGVWGSLARGVLPAEDVQRPDAREAMIRADEADEAARQNEVDALVALAARLAAPDAADGWRRSPTSAALPRTPTCTTPRGTPATTAVDAATQAQLERALRDGNLPLYHRLVAALGRTRPGVAVRTGNHATAHVIDPQTTVRVLRANPGQWEMYSRCVRQMERSHRHRRAQTPASPSPERSPKGGRDHVVGNVAVVPKLTRTAVLQAREEGFAATDGRMASARERKYEQDRVAQEALERKARTRARRMDCWARQQQRSNKRDKNVVQHTRLERRWWALVELAKYTEHGFMAMCSRLRQLQYHQRRDAAARVIQTKLFRGKMMRSKLANATRIIAAVRKAGGAQMVRNWKRKRRCAQVPVLRRVLRYLRVDRGLLFRVACHRFFEKVRCLQRFIRTAYQRRQFQLSAFHYQWCALERTLLAETKQQDMKKVRSLFRRGSRHNERLHEDKALERLRKLSRPSHTVSERIEKASAERKKSDAEMAAIAGMAAERELNHTLLKCPTEFVAAKVGALLEAKRKQHGRDVAAWAERKRVHEQDMEDYDFHMFIAQGMGAGATGDIPARPAPLPSVPVFWLRLAPEELEPLIRRGWRAAERERTFLSMLTPRDPQLEATPPSPPQDEASIISRAIAAAQRIKAKNATAQAADAPAEPPTPAPPPPQTHPEKAGAVFPGRKRAGTRRRSKRGPGASVAGSRAVTPMGTPKEAHLTPFVQPGKGARSSPLPSPQLRPTRAPAPPADARQPLRPRPASAQKL